MEDALSVDVGEGRVVPDEQRVKETGTEVVLSSLDVYLLSTNAPEVIA